jgi:hypothetical protein
VSLEQPADASPPAAEGSARREQDAGASHSHAQGSGASSEQPADAQAKARNPKKTPCRVSQCSWPGCQKPGHPCRLDPCNKCHTPGSVHHICGVTFVGDKAELIDEAMNTLHTTKWCWECFSQVRLTRSCCFGQFCGCAPVDTELRVCL